MSGPCPARGSGRRWAARRGPVRSRPQPRLILARPSVRLSRLPVLLPAPGGQSPQAGRRGGSLLSGKALSFTIPRKYPHLCRNPSPGIPLRSPGWATVAVVSGDGDLAIRRRTILSVCPSAGSSGVLPFPGCSLASCVPRAGQILGFLHLPGAGSDWALSLQAYNIHVNGVLHCRVRYSQLLGLHEQLRKEYGANVVPAFPPKKIFTLTPVEVEQRREQLEKYMQAVRQDPTLGGSETFNSFLRKAQQETQQIPTEEVVLEVLLSNGQRVKVTILTSDQTEDVLEAVASKLDLPDDLVGYFSLFLVRQTKDGAFSFVRKLQEFELPYVSVTSLHNPEFQIILRKSYWDSAYDDDVMEHRVGLNLLYAQTVSDIEHGWILVNKEQHRQLKSLQEKVSKKEFIRLAQTLKYYGYLKFDPCVTDFPEKGCHVVVSAGNNELNFQVRLPNEQIKEGSFKVTRMRCWRVTSSVPMSNGPSGSSPGKSEVKLELAFEYLMSKDRLQWVTITSPQAIMLSICLQSMVDELMVKKSGGSIRKMFRRRVNGALRRSDSQQAVKSPPLLDSPDASWEPMAKLSSKLTSVSLRGISHSSSANDVGANDFHGNYAFEGIGDEDL
ncbi:PREDICTED: sorting nexin-17 [Ficedula albicollis]|uniref:sorting nexin-17 n=1 Tax=Ficedula albicollis TaxID=59894 RepID=UPI0007AD7D68|nr:PREDICTED: sorting nexin-17 [Ficedula albicollis]